MVRDFEAFHDGGVGSNAVGVLLGLERSLEVCIRAAVVGNYNLLIDAERAKREAAGVVRVYFANVIYGYVQFIGR